MVDDIDPRIAELEDELKAAERRIDELRRERDEQAALVAEMREQVEEYDAIIERWIEAFAMEREPDGKWGWKSSYVEGDEWFLKHQELVKKWNKYVALFNDQGRAARCRSAAAGVGGAGRGGAQAAQGRRVAA